MASHVSWTKFVPRLTTKHLITIAGSVVIFFTVAGAANFFWPHNLAFTYSKTNCLDDSIVLPNLFTPHSSHGYTISLGHIVKLAGYPIYATSACITAIQPPRADKLEAVSLNLRGLSFLGKTIRIKPNPLPVLQSKISLNKPVGPSQPILFGLSSPDQIFTYQLQMSGLTSPCVTHGQTVSCDLAKLNLAQGTAYNFVMMRLFHGRPTETAFKASFTTVPPVSITGSSIAAESMVYNIPTSLALTLNRPATSFTIAQLALTSGGIILPATATASGATLTVYFTNPLPRNTSVALTIGDIIAPDGGHLVAPYALSFNLSGGPKVIGSNIGGIKAPAGGPFVLTFDSSLSTTQPIGNFIHLLSGSTAVSASITIRNNVVTIIPNANLGRCTPITLQVQNGLQNTAGVSGGSAWSQTSRTTCQISYHIGTSVLGRAIMAYSFGTGPSKIIYFGDMHGNEKSSKYTLDDWINTLEANPGRVPANRTIIVIPSLNPDGFAVNTRTNAHNVDLNRNFPANDWTPDVTEPNGVYYPTGGGTAPLSEPESAAMAAFILAQNPRLVLSYHAVGGIVLPNDAADSDALGHIYDQNSNVNFLAGNQSVGFFDYVATGAFEGWTNDKLGIATLVIELWTETGDELGGNVTALWAMATLP